jgi:hypothetical protein
MAISVSRLLAAFLPLLVALFPLLVVAQDTPKIYKDSGKYAYYGCYNETTDIAGSAKERALSGGLNEVLEGQMTVPKCMSFCLSGSHEYKYAGVEYSRLVSHV